MIVQIVCCIVTDCHSSSQLYSTDIAMRDTAKTQAFCLLLLPQAEAVQGKRRKVPTKNLLPALILRMILKAGLL